MAEPVRLVTWHVELSRDGPGLMLRDLARGDPQGEAVIGTLADTRPDIAVLTGVDWDHGQVLISVLAQRLSDKGHEMPHYLAPRPNSGMASNLDLDRDGRSGEPEDNLGYGRFAGDGGMAILSTYPIAIGEVRDYSKLLWKDLPDADLPVLDGARFLSDEVLDALPLSSSAHVTVPVQIGSVRLTLMAHSATPPVFDGPEDLNGRRNHDETLFWVQFLDALGTSPDGPVIFAGNANTDPVDGEGRKGAIRALLDHPRLQDPKPGSSARRQTGVNLDHVGDPRLDTGYWGDQGPGDLRVSYVLPDAALAVLGSGLVRPLPETGLRHALVWVDVELP